MIAAAFLGLSVAAYFQTFRDLWPLWTDTNAKSYTHGPLVVLIAAWLFWRDRHEISHLPVRPAPWVLPMVLVLSMAWLVAAHGNILTLHAVIWPLLALSVLWAAAGWRVARALAFPLGFLWFAVPVWDHVNGLLQSMTVVAVHLLTVITRVPAEIDGNLVTIPQGRFEIASGCSGLHFFIVGLALAALAGELHKDRLPTRLKLVAIAAGIALVANWLRVYLIILAGYLTDMKSYLVQVDHYKFGWVVFAVAMLGFFWYLRRLPVTEVMRTETRNPPAGPLPVAGLSLALVAAISLPLASRVSWALAAEPDLGGMFAGQVEGFAGPLFPSPSWDPVFRGPASESRHAYLAPSGRVLDYYGNAYLRQRQGEELVGYRNHVFPPRGFKERSRHVMRVAERPAVQVRATAANGQEWVALYRYEVGGRVVAHDLAAQLLGGFMAAWGPSVSGIRVVAGPCADDCETTSDELEVLLAGMTRNMK